MSKLSIAMVTPWMVRCGIFTYSEKLCNSLAQRDVDVYVVRLPRFGVKTPEILQSVARKVPLDKIDLIHVQHEYGLYKNLDGSFYGALRQLGKPIVTTCHATGIWQLDDVIVKHSDAIIVHNDYCASRFRHKPVHVIPHGCDNVECPPPEECKEILGVDKRAELVGYLGFISEYKGLETLINCIKDVKAGLLIAGGYHVEGDTTYISNLKQWSLSLLPGRCQWLGYVHEENLPYAYGAMKVLVYPSHFISESGALLTALGHGKACLSTNLPPVVEKEKKGALMTFKGLNDLRRKLKRVLKDDELRKGLENGARKYAEANSWSNVSEKHIVLYEKTMEKNEE